MADSFIHGADCFFGLLHRGCPLIVHRKPFKGGMNERKMDKLKIYRGAFP